MSSYNLEEIAITGNECLAETNTPVSALTDFYYAFNQGKIDVMSQNWLQSDEIAMDNPLGGIKRGWPEVKAVYRRIIQGPANVYVEFYDYSIHETQSMFYAVGRERGYFKTGDVSIDLKIRTSRIYRKYNDQWKQVHHHGSIEDPQLLQQYQQAVM